MEWLPASIFSVVVGIIAFFLKKTYANFETKMSEMRKDSDEKMSCLREDFQQESKAIREDFRISMNSQIKRIDKLEEKTGNDIQNIRHEINDIKGDFATTFVLREDFFRSMNGVEDRMKIIQPRHYIRKCDHIIHSCTALLCPEQPGYV